MAGNQKKQSRPLGATTEGSPLAQIIEDAIRADSQAVAERLREIDREWNEKRKQEPRVVWN